jgi:hypothetical protein
VDSHLARSMQLMLDFDADNTAFEEAFGVTFSASPNPILCSANTSAAALELIPGGGDVAVSKSNRQDFVRRFVQHALCDCCKGAVDSFLEGLSLTLHTKSLQLCTHGEVSISLQSLPLLSVCSTHCQID